MYTKQITRLVTIAPLIIIITKPPITPPIYAAKSSLDWLGPPLLEGVTDVVNVNIKVSKIVVMVVIVEGVMEMLVLVVLDKLQKVPLKPVSHIHSPGTLQRPLEAIWMNVLKGDCLCLKNTYNSLALEYIQSNYCLSILHCTVYSHWS